MLPCKIVLVEIDIIAKILSIFVTVSDLVRETIHITVDIFCRNLQHQKLGGFIVKRRFANRCPRAMLYLHITLLAQCVLVYTSGVGYLCCLFVLRAAKALMLDK